MGKGKGCPKCGSNQGFYANVKGVACYYTDGYPEKTMLTGKPVETVYCFNCGYRTTLTKLRERSKAKRFVDSLNRMALRRTRL